MEVFFTLGDGESLYFSHQMIIAIKILKELKKITFSTFLYGKWKNIYFALRNFWHFLLPSGCDPCAWEKPVVHLFWSIQSQCCRKCNHTESKSCTNRVPFSFVLDSSAFCTGSVGDFITALWAPSMGFKSPRRFVIENTPLPGVCVDIPLTHSRSLRSS